MSRLVEWLKRLRYTFIFLLVYFLWLWLGPDAAPQVYRLDGNTMGTRYQIQIVGFPASISDNELAQQIQQRLDRIDRELMSTYAPESELSRFNRSAPGDWFAVSPETAYVIERALYFSELTGGSFDVTVGPLVNRWGFGPITGQRADQSRIPSEQEIQALLQQIGYRKLQVELSPPRVRKLAPVYVDLSAIAKGYATDVIAEYFDTLAMDSYFIEIGGELRIKGLKPDGSGWVPAIETPVASEVSQLHQIFYSRGQSLAVASSGDYRNYFDAEGVRYSHEIDPTTGRPITHDLVSVTVIAADATQADALATAFMVMGEERAYALAQRLGLAVYFISRSAEADGFTERYTPEFSNYLEE